VYSVNVPVPDAVHDIARDLRPALTGFQRIRERHRQTLLLKRLPAADRREYVDAERRARDALRGAPAVEAQVTGLDAFYEPPDGSAPVLFLRVESPGLQQLHAMLVDEFGAVGDILEGDEYEPHITLARGDGPDLDPLLAREVDPITWTVEELIFYDATYYEKIGGLSLPN
jgi:2'-5' RNA ligase